MRELQLIDIVKKKMALQGTTSSLLCGIGDDCAVFRTSFDKWLISTDTMVENVHFDLGFHPPFKLGRKAIAVNLSDIAAMAGQPVYLTISLTLTPKIDEVWLNSFLDGIFSILQEYDVTLAGGDTVFASELSISVTVLGIIDSAIYRSGAKPGDVIYVSGHLGSSAAGLFLLQHNLQQVSSLNEEQKILVEHHLNPEPQIKLAQLLSTTGCLTAMQDISDGIATDLAHLAHASSVSATVFEEKLPIDPELLKLAESYPLSAIELALCGGEDYQLLFTVSEKEEKQLALEELAASIGCIVTKIGIIEAGEPEVILAGKDGTRKNISYQGYEHK